jgi:hypothetical protein
MFRGYAQFVSSVSVSRFNGYEFENFHVSGRFADNIVFLMTKNDMG